MYDVKNAKPYSDSSVWNGGGIDIFANDRREARNKARASLLNRKPANILARAKIIITEVRLEKKNVRQNN